MHIYATLLLIGVLGLLAQALLGVSHGGHASHAGHGGQGHGGHAGHGGHSHAAHGHSSHNNAGQTQAAQDRGPSPLWTLFSPLTLFSVCLGTGATGLLLRHVHAVHWLIALAAIVGGAVFYGLAVRPLWNLIFQFASTPSRALAGTVAETAEVLGHFDASGKGLVRLTIDGQIVRILAFLEPGELNSAVQPGDKLTVTSVDERANTCRVMRL